jgi:hypothetical protein
VFVASQLATDCLSYNYTVHVHFKIKCLDLRQEKKTKTGSVRTVRVVRTYCSVRKTEARSCNHDLSTTYVVCVFVALGT